MNIRRRIVAGVAIAAATALALSGCALPYQNEVIKGSQITVAYNDIIDEFNGSSQTGNNTKNSNILYMTSSGFNYYNNTPELVKNTDFGHYEKISDSPLTVKYTINDNVVWSDGTPIDGADLLLQWAAVFGYGKTDAGYLFAHAAPRDDLASKLPTVEGKSITFEYDKQYVDWELQFGLGVAAHGTVQLAYPDLSADDAKAKLIEAIKGNDIEWLTPVAQAWNTGYQSPSTPTNPLVSLSSGPYIVSELVPSQYVTLVANEKFAWGPSPKYEKITVRLIADSTAAVQAVDNGDIQIATGQPTADVLTLVQGLKNGKYETGVQASYEHIDLTFNNGGPFDAATYGGDAAKAQKVRKAFLLSIPRQAIIDKIVKPLNPSAKIRNSHLLIPGSSGYEEMVAANGSAAYSGSDADNLKAAKALLKEAGVKTPVKVGFWYPEGNVRRAQEFELISANAALAGFKLEDQSEPDWVFTGAKVNPHDAVIFAWSSTSLAVTGSDQWFQTGKPSNFSGYSNLEADKLFGQLDVALDPKKQLELQIGIEKAVWDDAFSITIFQFPGLVWWDKGVEGVKSNPLSPEYFWNFWEWKPSQN